jgi:voltage-gated sodium channel
VTPSRPTPLRRLVEHRAFQATVLALILGNAVVVGLETSRAVMERWGSWLLAANFVVQTAFVAELALRIAAHGRRPLAFFRNGWNVFDFAVVGASLLPAAGPAATVARIARVLRVGRLVSAFPELRLIIGTMLRSIPSMGHVIALLALLFYVYGVLGHHLYGEVDPAHWGSLPRTFDTLFQILTLEGWVEIRSAAGPGGLATTLFYTSFVFVAVFVVVNLFIAVVINNLETVKREEVGAAPPVGRNGRGGTAGPGARDGVGSGAAEPALATVARLREQLDELERSLAAARSRR